MSNRRVNAARDMGLALLALLSGAAGAGCNRVNPDDHKEGSGHVVLKPLGEPAKYLARIRRVVYVPVYSSIYWGSSQQVAVLAATLSIRNVSLKHALVVHSAKYYDSEGKEIREYIGTASTLAPMATADFVIPRRDTSGGPGANFLVEWSSAEDIDEPVIEAVMIGQHGNVGISFTSTGRVLRKASAELSASP